MRSFEWFRKMSSLSSQQSNLLCEIESEVAKDVGNRGISDLILKGDFKDACNTLSNSSSCAILLGFYVTVFEYSILYCKILFQRLLFMKMK